MNAEIKCHNTGWLYNILSISCLELNYSGVQRLIRNIRNVLYVVVALCWLNLNTTGEL